ncbi:TPA: DUF1642 domain-containing protein [Streptococcus suis]
MNKQEAIGRIENSYTLTIQDNRSDELLVTIIKADAIDIISQIHEPQKVVVPKFVAEWIEYCKTNELTLLGAFDPVSEHGIGLANTFTGEVWKGVDWAKRNQDIFARAWLFGYEIEQEKLYTVEIPNPNNISANVFCLRKDGGKIHISKQNYKTYRQSRYCHLTESEIKQDFEWAWQFAKEV